MTLIVKTNNESKIKLIPYNQYNSTNLGINGSQTVLVRWFENGIDKVKVK